MGYVEAYGKFFGRKIVVLDVGCRWGFSDVWTQLGPNVKLYGFDADETECDRLAERYRGQDITLVPRP